MSSLCDNIAAQRVCGSAPRGHNELNELHPWQHCNLPVTQGFPFFSPHKCVYSGFIHLRGNLPFRSTLVSSPCCFCTLVPSLGLPWFIITWGEIGTKELRWHPGRAQMAFATTILHFFIIELGDNQWNSKSFREGGESEGCDGERWGRGYRNMTVCAFSRRSFCCKKKNTHTVSLTGKRATDEGM